MSPDNLSPPAGYVRLGLTADSHLRDVHLGVARRGPDFTDGLNKAIEAALRYHCSALLHGGDILNTNRPSTQNVRDMRAVDRNLKEKDLAMFTISGNHDIADPPWINVVVDEIDMDHPAGIIPSDYRSFEVQGVTVHALPFLHKTELLEQLHKLPPADVILWHGSVQELSGFPQEENPKFEDLCLGKWRAFLMGDIHTRQFQDVLVSTFNVERACPTTLIGYPGATALVQRSDPLTHSIEIIDVPLDRTKPVLHFPVPIKTRETLVLNIMSEESMQDALKQIAAVAKDDPMIFVRFSPLVENAAVRLRSAVDMDKTILRAEAMGTSGNFYGVSTPSGAPETLRKLEDFAAASFSDSPDMARLAGALCNPEADANVLVAKYVEERLALNQQANTQTTPIS